MWWVSTWEPWSDAHGDDDIATSGRLGRLVGQGCVVSSQWSVCLCVSPTWEPWSDGLARSDPRGIDEVAVAAVVVVVVIEAVIGVGC